MNKTLKQLFQDHKGKISDKWSLYLGEWDRVFEPYRDQQINLLEIGVHNGGSLEVWGKYFQKAEIIIGCDLDEKCKHLNYDDARINIIVADVNSQACENEILQKATSFDIIIDDGSHKSSEIIRSFARYFPHLGDGGIYVVEDLHCSYWRNFEGGLYNPFSAMAFFKRLTDILNYEHWRNNISREEILVNFEEEFGNKFDEFDLTRIHSIEFINSLCIIKKLPPENNVLGKRIVVGKIETVSNNWNKLNGTVIQDIVMEIKDDASLDVFELIKYSDSLKQVVSDSEQSIQNLIFQISEKNKAVQALTFQMVEKEKIVQALTTQAVEKEKAVQALTIQAVKKEKAVQALTTQVDKKDLEIQSLSVQIIDKEKVYKALNLQLSEMEKNLKVLNTQLSEYQQNLTEIKSSKAWKVAANLRRIRVMLIPPNSRRARLLRFLIGPIIKDKRYRNLNKDLKLIRSSGLFEKDWYLAKNPDVAKAKVDPERHYLLFGGFEGRDPGPNFSSTQYFENHGDIKTSRINPLIHYLKYRNLNSAAKNAALQVCLDRLQIYAKSDDLLANLETTLTENNYSQSLENLFALERFISVSHNNSNNIPIMQASKIPKLNSDKTRRRILFITSMFPSTYHGGGNHVINFIKILSEFNDVYLATSYNPVEDDNVQEKITPYCRAILKIPYWQFGGNQVEIRKWLNDIPIDIVHYEWFNSLTNYDPALGKHHIFTYMEAVCLRDFIDLNKLKTLSKEWVHKFADLIHALRVELVDTAPLNARITVTTKDAEFLSNIYPNQQYTVLNHGITFNEYTLSEVESELHTLVYTGNYDHYPNTDAMIFFFKEIWPGVCKEFPDARIYVVGSNPGDHITSLADGKQVIVTGRVPDVRPYIQKASFGIAPIISGAGIRVKVIEYAALHRTFVATSIATAGLVFENGKDYFQADTADEFTRKIITLFKDEDLAKQMASAAFKSALNNYDNHNLVEYQTRLYDLLDEHIPPKKLEKPFKLLSSSINVQEWLSFYEKRSEILPRTDIENELFRHSKVSILVLTYNNYLINQLCLRSIYCNTTYPNFEVIVVDNGSTDETPNWLNSFAMKHSNLKIAINKENRGFSGGNNQAASLATGEYLIFLNNDTVVTNGWVERLLLHMQSDPKIGIIGPVTNSTGNEARISTDYHSPIEMEALSDWRARYISGRIFDIHMLAFYCAMVRKNQFESIGGLDERFLVGMFEDEDLAIRYAMKGQRVVCAEDVFIHHFQGASFGKLNKIRYDKLFKENKKRFEEKWGRKWEPHQFRKET